MSRILSKVGLSVETTTSTEENSIIREIISKSAKSSLNGVGIVNEIQVSNWLSFSKHAFVPERLVTLNNVFVTKSYLVANTFSIADVAVFVFVSDNAANLDAFPSISRWFNHIKRLTGSDDTPRAATVFPASFFTIASSSGAAAATEAPAAAAEPAAKTDSKETKADNKKDGKKEAAAAAAAPKEEASATAGLDPSKLDIRVGLVVKCWNHPDSDKLLCEEIDVGEGSTRTIASGLRAFYKAEEVQGRKVMVLANLKERPMAGFMSQVYTHSRSFVVILTSVVCRIGYGVVCCEE